MRHQKSWTPEEIALLKARFKTRRQAEAIAAEMGRTAKSVAEKAYALGLGRRHGRGRKKKYTFKKAGVPYKSVLPPEAWPMIQRFMGELTHYAGLAQEQGVRPDVAAFMAEYGGHKRGRSL